MLYFSREEVDAIFTTLWEHGQNGIAILNEDGFFKHANPAFCRLTEYTETELQSLRFEDITHHEDRAADITQAKEVAQGKRPHYSMKKRYFTKTNKLIWIDLSVYPIFMADGSFNFFISQISEIEFSQIASLSEALSKPTLSQTIAEFVKDINPKYVIAFLMALGVIVAEAILRLHVSE